LRSLKIWGAMMVLLLSSFTVLAFAPVPRESAKALQVTRGRAFSSGAVFINGRYVEPPYVVERWGTGIRINGLPVTGQVIDWNEFVKTQAGCKVVKTESAAPSAPEPTPAAVSEPEEDVNANSLDSLFDDDPAPAQTAVSRKPVTSRPPVAPRRPAVSLTLEGDFVSNDATKAMLGRINALRTEIDRTLRAGGFICFGDTYSQVTGDSRTLLDFLEKVPECQRTARDEQDFCNRIRAAGLIYLNEVLRMDLYRNRADYRKLQARRTRLKKDSEMQKILDEVSTPLF